MQQARDLLPPTRTDPRPAPPSSARRSGKTKWAAARLTTRASPKRAPRRVRLLARASSGGGRGTGVSGDAHDADKTAFTILARNSPGVLQVRAASRPPVLFKRPRKNISRVPTPTSTAPPPIPDADDIVRGRRRRLQHRVAQRRHAPHRRLPVVRHHGRRAAHATRVLNRPRTRARRRSVRVARLRLHVQRRVRHDGPHRGGTRG